MMATRSCMRPRAGTIIRPRSRLTGCRAEVNARSNRGITPLYKAAEYSNPASSEVLLAAGAEVNARMKKGAPRPCIGRPGVRR